MKAVLQVLSGTSADQRIELGCGETVEVGRTQRAEIVFPDDAEMSSLHFSLTCEPDECRLRDLDSTNGTYLNGTKVTTAVVQNGDEITAGRTRFAVHLQPGQAAASRHDPRTTSHPPKATGGPTSATTDPVATANEQPLAGSAQDEDALLPTGNAEPPPPPPPPPPPTPASATAPSLVAPAVPPPPADQPAKPASADSIRLERVILEIRSGVTSGRRVWLRTGQVLQVGRTEEADFVVADDPQMSRIHFSLQCGRTACRLVDCDSDGGTSVNGKQVAEATLQDGDQITAGQTTFVAKIVGGAPVRAATPPAVQSAVDHHPSVISGEVAVPAPAYVPQPCSSGLTLFRGTGPPQDPISIAGRLAQEFPLFLIIDFNKLQIAPPPEPVTVDYLYDWLPPEAAVQASPVVLSADECDECFALAKEGWGKDGLICVYTRQDKAATLEHLRSLARSTPPGNEEHPVESAVVALCWPRIVSALLANTTSEHAEHLMSSVEAILLEGETPESWQIIGRPDLAATLDRLGFVAAAVEPDSPEPSADQ